MPADSTLFDEVARRFGGRAAMAKALGETVYTVNNWRARGFPVHKCKQIELMTGISVRRLRPDDWASYWPSDKRAALLRRTR
jgi:DNA-binding transcriptional regulator YdaS (Cro superfamily)